MESVVAEGGGGMDGIFSIYRIYPFSEIKSKLTINATVL
jgi:hypothetical protein